MADPDDDTLYVARNPQGGRGRDKHLHCEGCPHLDNARTVDVATAEEIRRYDECTWCSGETIEQGAQDWSYYRRAVAAGKERERDSDRSQDHTDYDRYKRRRQRQ